MHLTPAFVTGPGSVPKASDENQVVSLPCPNPSSAPITLSAVQAPSTACGAPRSAPSLLPCRPLPASLTELPPHCWPPLSQLVPASVPPHLLSLPRNTLQPHLTAHFGPLTKAADRPLKAAYSVLSVVFAFPLAGPPLSECVPLYHLVFIAHPSPPLGWESPEGRLHLCGSAPYPRHYTVLGHTGVVSIC